MSAFAGIVSVGSREPVSASLARELTRSLSRSADDAPRVIEGAGFVFAKLDLGLFEAPGEYVDDEGAVSLLAGEPLLKGTASGETRLDELRRLHEFSRDGRRDALKGARGSFCSVHFDPAARRLSLVSDKIGLRPIYYAAHNGYVFFSTALRVLESLSALPKTLDLRGLAESAIFGYPLGTRSPYTTIATIAAGEVVEFTRRGADRSQYWRWDDLAPGTLSTDELARALFETFRAAIRRRLKEQRAVAAFLSGGLDSRCIVACLRSLGVEVHTLNFAPPGGEDLVLGKLAAEKLGTHHFEYPEAPTDFWARLTQAHRAWLQTDMPRRVARPRVIWAGDGGSVGVGHVYINEEVVALMRQGRVEDAVDAYFRYNDIRELPGRLFLPRYRERVREYPRAGVLEELGKLNAFDEGRRFHLYLVLNDQRRHLARHFEDIDLQRVELVVPFFDAEFLTLILSHTVDAFLRHKFYLRWLQEFSPETTSTAWQSYPGHEPCPLPKPSGLRAQWDSWSGTDEARRERAESLAAADRALRDPRFPVRLLNRRLLRFAGWLTKTGVRDYSYLSRLGSVVTQYAKHDDSHVGPSAGRGAPPLRENSHHGA